MSIGEFDLIERYFNRPGRREGVLLGVGDDAALLELPPGQCLVAATDTLVEGRHFPCGAPPESIGHQCLAVNLSDLAAMGADPAWALLSLCMPEARAEWLQRFATGLLALAERYGVALVGGDTVRGPLVLGVTALGVVPPGEALRRSGARPGDELFVSGWPGESAAGLELLQRDSGSAGTDPLARRFLFPEPRLGLGRALRGLASAAMDVSDGLLGDLEKLCRASSVSATLELDQLPVSPVLAARFPPERAEQFILHGGDDYELLFTLPPGARSAEQLQRLLGACVVHRIGRIGGGRGVSCLRDGRSVGMPQGGYDHFA
ncbi:MAG TPA: thiamine-phosphate kinase [Steroidobacteraceae bacterium]|nr:thiamine-phosphate kinase [Steroidobacteraceae bacterium]